MKIINYCWTCRKEHDLSNVHFIGEIKNVKCDCGGYVISPSGKALFRIVEEEGEQMTKYDQKETQNCKA